MKDLNQTEEVRLLKNKWQLINRKLLLSLVDSKEVEIMKLLSDIQELVYEYDSIYDLFNEDYIDNPNEIDEWHLPNETFMESVNCSAKNAEKEIVIGKISDLLKILDVNFKTE